MKKAFKALIILILLSLLFANKTFAKSNFSADYLVEYSVLENATTHVNFNIKLKNLSQNYYVSSYNLNLGFKDLQNLKVSDSQGKIVPEVTSTIKGSTLSLKINKRVVGINNILDFNISFDTKEIAQNLNHVWDINIPGISNENEYSAFNVSINYPVNLGKPRYIKPAPAQGLASNSGKLKFTKKDLEGSGISISFGDYQIYDLNLKYNLENKNLFSVLTEIALPPDTGYQTIQINDINPKPLNVERDADGNWLAKYKLGSLQKIQVSVSGKAKIALTPRTEEINDQLKSSYLGPQKYWESDNPIIIKLAKQFKTPFQIYKFVVNTLNYDYAKVEKDTQRLGAIKALSESNSAVCLEFTDLFIAIARAAGIPAREVDGFAYTSNASQRPVFLAKDILHAWPQYYDFDKKMWIMIDPTWSKTTGGVDYFNTLDFDHIAFVIKGVNSNYPIPAGGYKFTNQKNTNDVGIKIGSNFTEKEDITAKILDTKSLIAGFPQQIHIEILNNGNQAINNKTVNLSTNLLNPTNKSIISGIILPFGNDVISNNFQSPSFLTNTQDTIKITVENKTFYKKLNILPFFKHKSFILGGIIFVSIIIIISIITYAARRLPIFRQKK